MEQANYAMIWQEYSYSINNIFYNEDNDFSSGEETK